MYRKLPLIVIAAMFASCSPPVPTTSGITMSKVKWPELEKVIAANQGKIVVVDLWAEY